jgi:hypothetical protein
VVSVKRLGGPGEVFPSVLLRALSARSGTSAAAIHGRTPPRGWRSNSQRTRWRSHRSGSQDLSATPHSKTHTHHSTYIPPAPTRAHSPCDSIGHASRTPFDTPSAAAATHKPAQSCRRCPALHLKLCTLCLLNTTRVCLPLVHHMYRTAPKPHRTRYMQTQRPNVHTSTLNAPCIPGLSPLPSSHLTQPLQLLTTTRN